MVNLRLSEDAFNLPLSLNKPSCERLRMLATSDRLDLVLVKSAIYETRAILRRVRQALVLYRAIFTMSANNAVALDAIVESLIGI